MTSRHGLANVGNTCYLNSAFQALFRVKPFAEYFGTEAWTKHRHEKERGYELAGHTADLVTALLAPGDTCVNPRDFARSFVMIANEFNPAIRPLVQADAAEALQILLDVLHTQQAREVNMNIKGVVLTADQGELMKSLESWSTYYKKEYSPLTDVCFGQTQKKVVCEKCHNCSTSYEPWGVFKAPIPGADVVGASAPTLDECISKALESEKLDDYYCNTCAMKGPATIQLSISKFPKYMMLSLKRFVGSGAKVRCRIPYDENSVDLSKWRAWPSIQGSQTFRVRSTVEHLGGSRGGHYVMRTRDDADGKWYLYNDGHVSECAAGGAATPDTYIHFLERI